MAFSPDGATVASGSQGDAIRLWNTQTGELTGTLGGYAGRVTAVAFSPDGAVLASRNHGDTVRLWDIQTGELRETLEGHTGDVFALADSRDGAAQASGRYGRIRLRNNLSPNGATLASWSYDKTIRLRSTQTGELLETLEGHTGPGSAVAFSPDGATLASGSRDETIRLWDLGSREHALIKVSGDQQEAPPGTSLQDPLVVEVRQQNGDGVAGAPVAFAVTNGGGILSVEHTVTDSHGRAESILTLGTGPGTKTVKVRGTGLNPVTFTAVASLRGHSESISSVAVSTDGVTLASGGGDEAIRLWNTRSDERMTLEGHTGSVLSVAFSPDRITLASGSRDETIRLWNTRTGELVKTLEGHLGDVLSVAFSPDGVALSSGGADQTIRLWDTQTGELTKTLEGHTGRVLSVAFSPDGVALSSGGADQTIRLWDTQTGELTKTLEGHTGRVPSVAFSPNGVTLASGSWDETIRLWNTRTGEVIRALEGSEGGVNSVAYSPDGATLASGSSGGGTIRWWNTQTGELKKTLRGHTGGVNSVAFYPDGTTLVSGSRDETIRVWELGSTEPVLTKVSGDQQEASPGTPLQHPLVVEVRQQNGEVVAGAQVLFAVSKGGGTLSVEQTTTDWRGRAESVLTLGPDLETNTVEVTDAGLNRVTFTAAGWSARSVLRGHTASVQSVAFSPDGATLASGSRDETIRLWNTRTGQLTRTLEGHTYWVGSVAFAPDGVTLASGSGDRTIRLWNTQTGELTRTLEHLGAVHSVAFSPDGATLASGGDASGIRLWNTKTGEPGKTLGGIGDGFRTVTFSPDGITLASVERYWVGHDAGGYMHSLYLWNTRTGDYIGYMRHTPGFFSVRFSPDGATLASGSWRTIRLWNTQTGELMGTLEGHRSRVQSLAFSPDGIALASGGVDDDGIRFWDTESGEFIGTLEGHAGGVNSVAFSPDGATLASGSSDHTIRLWNVLRKREGFPHSLTKVSGDGQTGPSGAPLGHPFVIEVRDRNGDPVSGARVAFAVVAGGGTLSVGRTITDSEGRAGSILTLGPGPGTQMVEAAGAGLEPVTFTAVGGIGPDFNRDGVVDLSDFFLFADAFGSTNPRYDLDGSGTVDFADFYLFADYFDRADRAKLLKLAQGLIGLPDRPQLQNAPNPFNSQTIISYFLTEAGPAQVEVFNLIGQRVTVLTQEPQKAGLHRLHWDGKDDQGRVLASGIYLYRLVTPQEVIRRKLTVLR